MSQTVLHGFRILTIGLALAVSGQIPDAWAADPAAAQRRLEEMAATVQSMLEARDRIASEQKEPADSAAARKEVTDLLKTGRESLAKGAFAEAETALRRSYDKATAMIVSARSGQKLENKRQEQYATSGRGDGGAAAVTSRQESVRALLDAYRRVVVEKNKADPQGVAQVETLLSQSDGHVKAGRMAEARQSVSQAYDLVTGLVASVRQGDRLVKTLKFDTPAEEYAYEIDRNNSFRMLLKMTSGSDPSAPAAKQAAVTQSEADVLRGEAEKAATAGRHAEAIRILEKATSGLAKAIRANGLFIPTEP
ncbi:MAG: hypothetical protein ABT940_08765 [Alphaproteobacteria bacterium]